VKAHLPKLGKVSCGKGCIRFQRISDLNLEAVDCLLREILDLKRHANGNNTEKCWTGLKRKRHANGNNTEKCWTGLRGQGMPDRFSV
jgi:hypothetical protein